MTKLPPNCFHFTFNAITIRSPKIRTSVSVRKISILTRELGGDFKVGKKKKGKKFNSPFGPLHFPFTTSGTQLTDPSDESPPFERRGKIRATIINEEIEMTRVKNWSIIFFFSSTYFEIWPRLSGKLNMSPTYSFVPSLSLFLSLLFFFFVSFAPFFKVTKPKICLLNFFLKPINKGLIVLSFFMIERLSPYFYLFI